MPCGSSRRYNKRYQNNYGETIDNTSSETVFNTENSKLNNSFFNNSNHLENSSTSQKKSCFKCGNTIYPTDVFCSTCGVIVT